ncbi:helix-turn-helix domain-containing protein [Mangrovicoccus ximenensis]|uniref:helix-turn-helix domain-containing protein n=1 Tax=Mangrovicoccus ximenensis TaxID=1911570 RepID=UPI000D346BEE|nr:AraC family transcriptional regulator [Mangrovicoccus ximenensis]
MLGLLAMADVAPRSTPRTALRHARRAMDYIETHFRDISTVAEIAAACGTGIRSLELAFRDVWGLSPNQALTEIRLLAARQRLALPGPPATVAEIAMDCGFGHLGRFPAQYRARFGELPSATLKRSRG